MFPLARQSRDSCLLETEASSPERPGHSPYPPSEIAPPEPPPNQPDEPSDLDDVEVPCTDDRHWEVFIPDDDLYEPLPDRGDFWTDRANDEFSNDG